jgi:hypothetical protein
METACVVQDQDPNPHEKQLRPPARHLPALGAPILQTAGDDHMERRRRHVEPFGDVLADPDRPRCPLGQLPRSDLCPSLTAPTDNTTKSKPAITAFHVKTRFKLNWSSQGDAISHRPITASQILNVIADTESRISKIPIARAFHDAAASIRIGFVAWRSTQGEIKIQTTRIARRGSDHPRCMTTFASLMLRGNLTQNLVMVASQYFDVSQAADKNPTGEQECGRGLRRRYATEHCDSTAHG